jgi:hypothetical protein
VPREETTASDPLEAALALRTVLRGSLSATDELISSLKRQKRQTRLVESTLASLRQLQSAS